ncbi:hypothetical protein EVAR_73360_1 [Eumeta japonica]|uniref:Uncharacterized protein n=1 Tax=Eumeta variegata TaxID=151549 RepID=A0A4C1SQN7_EUMVA|nr:hypothetical protein EVAR_73360_1 [Eumeta japonica]
MYALGPVVPKTKEVKNSLIVETADNVPKLSLGTVIKNDDFSIGSTPSFIEELASKTVNKASLSPALTVEKEKEFEEKSKSKETSLEGLLPFPKSSTTTLSSASHLLATEEKDNNIEDGLKTSTSNEKPRPFKTLTATLSSINSVALNSKFTNSNI